MKKSFFIFILLVPLAMAAPLKKKPLKKQPLKKHTKITVVKTSPVPIVAVPEPVRSPFFVNASFGASRWEGMGFFSGVGLGLFPAPGERLGWGLEGQLLLVSSGSLFSILGGAWYYLSHPLVSRRFVSLGVLFGAGFPGGGLPLSKKTAIGFCEISGNQRLSDYGWLRLWTRGGLLDGEAIAQLGLSLLFQLK